MPNLVQLATPELAAAVGAKWAKWRKNPVGFVIQVIGTDPDPWQCDVLDTLAADDVQRVALRSCRGAGKTATEAWAILWFLITRPESIVVSTAPTYNKQVRDVLWGRGVNFWWRRAIQKVPDLTNYFECQLTRFQAKEAPTDWFGVGIPSREAANLEGYHADNILIVFDEAKAIPKPTWESVPGMMTGRESKFIAASTPSAMGTEFHRVFTEYRSTWKHLFAIHPEALRTVLNRPAGEYRSRGGIRYSNRVPASWVREQAAERGVTSPWYISQVVGDFPLLENNRLIRYDLIIEARGRPKGSDGPVVIGCDVADTGADRTVIFALRGGTVIDGIAIGLGQEDTSVDIESIGGVGDDKKRPRYRDEVTTARLCVEMARKHGAVAIAVDAQGIGSGVVAILRRSGFQIIPVNFGGVPPDRPEDAEDRKWKARREGADTQFANMKAAIAWWLRIAFEEGEISLAALDDPATEDALLQPLLKQLGGVRHDLNAKGYTVIIDPDMSDADDSYFEDPEERKRSPDHFHALIIAWYAARHFRRGKPEGGRALKHDVSRVGHLPARTPGTTQPAGSVPGGTVPQPISKSGYAGQAVYLDQLR